MNGLCRARGDGCPHHESNTVGLPSMVLGTLSTKYQFQAPVLMKYLIL